MSPWLVLALAVALGAIVLGFCLMRYAALADRKREELLGRRVRELNQ